MSIEMIVDKINSQRLIIEKAQKQTDQLVASLLDLTDEEKDWVTVQLAAKIVGVSENIIYDKINNGTLTVRFVSKRRFVKRFELLKSNDKYEV